MEGGMVGEQTTAQAGPPAAAIVFVNADERERAGLAARPERRYAAAYDVSAVMSNGSARVTGIAGLRR